MGCRRGQGRRSAASTCALGSAITGRPAVSTTQQVLVASWLVRLASAISRSSASASAHQPTRYLGWVALAGLRPTRRAWRGGRERSSAPSYRELELVLSAQNAGSTTRQARGPQLARPRQCRAGQGERTGVSEAPKAGGLSLPSPSAGLEPSVRCSWPLKYQCSTVSD